MKLTLYIVRQVTTVLLATAAVAVAVAAADAATTGLRSRLTTPHKRRGDPFARLKRQRASRGIYARHAKREGSGEEGGVKAEPNKITDHSAVSREDTANKKEEKQLRKEEPVEAVEEAAESEPKDGYIQVSGRKRFLPVHIRRLLYILHYGQNKRHRKKYPVQSIVSFS